MYCLTCELRHERGLGDVPQHRLQAGGAIVELRLSGCVVARVDDVPLVLQLLALLHQLHRPLCQKANRPEVRRRTVRKSGGEPSGSQEANRPEVRRRTVRKSGGEWMGNQGDLIDPPAPCRLDIVPI